MDPELQVPDPVWQAIKSGKGHIYYALFIIIVMAIVMAPTAPFEAVSIAALAAGVFADCWAHEVLH